MGIAIDRLAFDFKNEFVLNFQDQTIFVKVCVYHNNIGVKCSKHHKYFVTQLLYKLGSFL